MYALVQPDRVPTCTSMSDSRGVDANTPSVFPLSPGSLG